MAARFHRSLLTHWGPACLVVVIEQSECSRSLARYHTPNHMDVQSKQGLLAILPCRLSDPVAPSSTPSLTPSPLPPSHSHAHALTHLSPTLSLTLPLPLPAPSSLLLLLHTSSTAATATIASPPIRPPKTPPAHKNHHRPSRWQPAESHRIHLLRNSLVVQSVRGTVRLTSLTHPSFLDSRPRITRPIAIAIAITITKAHIQPAHPSQDCPATRTPLSHRSDPLLPETRLPPLTRALALVLVLPSPPHHDSSPVLRAFHYETPHPSHPTCASITRKEIFSKKKVFASPPVDFDPCHRLFSRLVRLISPSLANVFISQSKRLQPILGYRVASHPSLLRLRPSPESPRQFLLPINISVSRAIW